MFFIPLFSSNLTTNKFGRKIEYLRTVDSTNQEAKRMIDKNYIQSGNIIISDEQTNGQGRRGDKWFSSPGKSLTFSLLIKNEDPKLIQKLPLICGISAIKGIKQLTNCNCTLKWPNDIMYENSKLGGILIEQTKQHFIIGIGINVNDSTFDSSIEKEASSLYSILGRPIQREPLLAFILNNLEQSLHLTLNEIIIKWESYCAHMNAFIKFHNANEIINAKFLGLNNEGFANMELNQEHKIFNSGVIQL